MSTHGGTEAERRYERLAPGKVSDTLGQLVAGEVGEAIRRIERQTAENAPVQRVVYLASRVAIVSEAAALCAVSDLEVLTTGMSRKIWQKISLLHLAQQSPQPGPAPQPLT